MVRRLKTYRTANNSVVAEPSVQFFFKKQCVSVYSESVNTSQKDALNGLKIYIERVRNWKFISAAPPCLTYFEYRTRSPITT